MSLVDYASSSDEEEETEIGVKDNAHRRGSLNGVAQPLPPHPQNPPPPAASSSSQTKSMGATSDQQQRNDTRLPPPPIEKLPDASLLLSSPTLPNPFSVSDHSSRVMAAMAENASRKREGNNSTLPQVRGKIPKGYLPHTKNVPEPNGGVLVPPQLRGRSNVVTEDISKLFVRKQGQS